MRSSAKAVSWNTELNDGPCVLEELSRCEGKTHKVTVISRVKSSENWCRRPDYKFIPRWRDINTWGSHFCDVWTEKTFRQGCVVMKREHTQSAPINQLSISIIFSHLCLCSCITLLSSLASELLISLFVKMTLAGSISFVPLSLKSLSQLSPLTAHLAEVRWYHSDCCDSSTLAYSWREESHFTGVLKYP